MLNLDTTTVTTTSADCVQESDALFAKSQRLTNHVAIATEAEILNINHDHGISIR